MNRIKKIKPIVEWILTWALKLRLRKTYWSIAVPIGLVILGEIGNKIDYLVKATYQQYTDAGNIWAEYFWGILHFWFSVNLPWWSISLLILMLLLFTFVWWQENKAKRLGTELTVEGISNNIFNRLSKKIDEKIDVIKAELTFQPNQNWFRDQCTYSIDDLGKRYTPELNVKLEISEIFEGLGRTAEFNRKVTRLFDQLLIKGKKVLRDQTEIKESLERLEQIFDELYKLFNESEFLGINPLPINKFQDLLTQAQDTVHEVYGYYITEERRLQKEKNDFKYYHKYGYELRKIREFENELKDFQVLINSSTFKLANNPFLLLYGEAGIGKSHLIGDIVTRRIDKKFESVFLLGQHFVSEEDPWTQIFKRLQINSKAEDFLTKLNQHAKESGKRLILFIDALNEGKGNYFWNLFIKSFIASIKKYEWLGLVLTVRTSYKDLIFPKEEIDDLDVVEHTHYGFKGVEYETSTLFFDNYNIELPNVPLLHPEFQNPLFLKLFCEGINKAGLTRIPDGLQGITSIINFFINNVNNVLSKPKRIGYSDSLNLVQKSIFAFIRYKVDSQIRYVPYEIAYQVINESISAFIDKKGFIDELIKEGVFSKNLYWKEDNTYEEGVYLAYERFEDHLTAQYLIEKHHELEKEFKEGGELSQYIKNEYSININRGLIDAFSIQIPEKFGCEFNKLLPHLQDNYPIIESFVESLIWRKTDTIDENSKNYVNKHVFTYEGTHDLFWETILSVTGVPDHLFNASFLHNFLSDFSLSDRDGYWTQFLKDRYSNDSSVKRLIDWAWNLNERSHISDESVFLYGITLAWFHTSTNRELRDCSTKAIVCLLQNRIPVLIKILEAFEKVNDPYVYERLFAVAYGCSLRTSQKEYLVDLSTYVFQTIFRDKDEVYPHVLLRDYARGVIEFTCFSGLKSPFEIERVRPPYKSSFPDGIMTNEQIKTKYKKDYKAEDYKKYYWSQNSILSSMSTGMGYGDFGRYTFSSALECWDIDINNLRNIAIEWIFEKYGYNVEKHGKYDSNTDSIGRRASNIERIGKKYQWIAFYELLARVSDNFKKYNKWSVEEVKEEKYEGPWDPYVRDIDPTMIINKTGTYDDEQHKDFWWVKNEVFNWDVTNSDWVNDSECLPNFDGIIQVMDDKGEEWLVLEGYPSWSEPKKIGEEKWDQPHKELWTQIRSYLVKAEEFNALREWAVQQNFMGRWMPESGDYYQMFSREYYWSPAQKYFKAHYDERTEWVEIYDKVSGKYIAEVHLTSIGFSWGEEFDKSKEETISFLKPSTIIYEGMGLVNSQNEGEFHNTSEELECFAPNVYHDSKSYLIVRKSSFLNFLDENKFKIIWTVSGEKQIIGGRSFSKDYPGRLEISGSYYFDSSEINGKINTKNIGP